MFLDIGRQIQVDSDSGKDWCDIFVCYTHKV